MAPLAPPSVDVAAPFPADALALAVAVAPVRPHTLVEATHADYIPITL
jgi:hypothetical protein